ncbi:MAG: ATP-dependent helicase [Bacilli bacterium]
MLSSLNDQQKAAVLETKGPVMVFAGAGSGKTRTLTYRIAYMISNENIKPSHILAITFTNKATNEMRERLYKLIGIASHDITISTFHAFCARILRKEIPALEYDRSFSILDEEEQLKIIADVLKENNVDRKQYSAKTVQKTINFTKCFMQKPEFLFDQKIMDWYETKMKSLNLLDFEDLLLKTHQLFTEFPDVLKKYQNYFQYVLVDEFQDTNLVQYELMKMLTHESRNLFVVGDDDQSIYSFRGTNYENMNLFKKDFPEYKMFFLTQNYRSTQHILDGCNLLISNNQNREPKKLFSEEIGEPEDVQIYQAFNEKEEVDYLLDRIFSLKLRGVDYSKIAVLYRNSSLLRNLELGIIQMGLPYQVFGGISYLRRREVKDVIAYFKLLVNPDDTYSFQRIINVPTRSLGEATIAKVLEIKKKYRLPLSQAIEACQTLVSDKRYAALMEFKNLINEFSLKLETDSLLSIFDELLERIKYEEYLKEDEDYEERWENIQEFKSILMQIEETAFNMSRKERLQAAFDEAILSDDKLQNQKQNKDGITLSTIHSVKGLEFDYVFVIGLEENIFPNVYRFAQESELEEERRIAYVAFTRAKKRLYLLSTKTRLLYGERFSNKTSRFVLEFAGINRINGDIQTEVMNDVVSEEPQGIIANQVKDDMKISMNEYRVGDKVIHDQFGEGIIIAINRDIGQIFFDKTKSLSKILLTHGSLKRK